MKTALLIPGLMLLQAQSPTSAPAQPQDFMLASDKIFTVLIVVLLIWGGIITFLVLTGVKLKKMERELQSVQNGQKHPAGKKG
jgi:hypothetical protein